MTTDWAITTATERISLDSQRAGSISFTVSNPGPVHDRAVLDVVVSDNAEARWFTVEMPQRLVSAGSSVPWPVILQLPAEAPAGEYSFQGRVYSADTAPEESSKLSKRIVVSMAGAAPKKKPWWILAAVLMIVLVLGVAGYLVLGPKKEDPKTSNAAATPSAAVKPSPSPVTATVPPLVGGTEASAKSTLEGLGLKIGAVKHRQQPADDGKVLKQSIADGTTVEPGTAVDLEVAVSLGPVALSAPARGATFPKGSNFPTLSWEPVPNAAGYQVKVITEVCVYIIFGAPCTFSDQDKLGGKYADYHSRSFQNVTGTTYTPAIVFKVDPEVVRAGHSGNVRWQVVALDDFGQAGPDSGYFEFHVVLRDPDVWGNP